MQRLMLAVLLSLLGIVALHAGNAKQSIRVELAKQQHSLGYSLVDVRAGEVYVVSVEDRTSKQAKARDIQKLESVQCSSPDGRYSVFHKSGLWLRDNESGEALQVDAEGQHSEQCFSPENKFVYYAGKMVRVYDIAKKKTTDVGEGNYPTWSPDGEWLGFDDGKHYVLLNLKAGTRKNLFSNKTATSAN